MNISELLYRLRLARGFLDEARQDVSLQRWRSALDNSQLAVEHAAKSVLALLGPVGRTHNPAVYLRQALEQGRFNPSLLSAVLARRLPWLKKPSPGRTDRSGGER